MFWKLCAFGFAGILDLAVGFFVTHFLAQWFGYELAWWHYAIGAFLGASPDIDLVAAFIKKNPTSHHEYLTHRPIFGISFAAFLGWIVGGEFWAWCAGLCVFWHYLHDTEGFLSLTDNGIAWLWPVSKKYWGMRGGRIVGKSFEEFEAEEDKKFEIYDKFLMPTRRALTEFIVFSILLVAILGDLFGWAMGVVVAFVFWAAIVEIWDAYEYSSFRLMRKSLMRKSLEEIKNRSA